MAAWTFDLHPLNNGTPLLSDVPLLDATFGWVLNAPGGLEMRLPVGHSDVTRANFAPAARELRVKRDGTLVWGGYLWGADLEIAEPNPPAVVVRAEGYYSILRHYFVLTDLIYTDVAQETILRNLIEHAESQTSGERGLTTTLSGNHTGGSILRDRAYCLAEHLGVADSIDELSAMDDGLDFEIGPSPDQATNKLLKTWQPRKGTDRTATLTIDQAKASTLGYSLSGDTIASRMLTIGGGGDCNPAEDDRSDSTALSTYGLLMGVDSIESDRLVDVVAHNKEQLRTRKVPHWAGQFEVHESKLAWGDLVVGDTFTLASNRGLAGGFANFSQTVRAISFDVTVQPGADDADDGIVFYTVGFDSVTT